MHPVLLLLSYASLTLLLLSSLWNAGLVDGTGCARTVPLMETKLTRTSHAAPNPLIESITELKHDSKTHKYLHPPVLRSPPNPPKQPRSRRPPQRYLEGQRRQRGRLRHWRCFGPRLGKASCDSAGGEPGGEARSADT